MLAEPAGKDACATREKGRAALTSGPFEICRLTVVFSNRLLAAAEDQQAGQTETGQRERGRFRHRSNRERRNGRGVRRGRAGNQAFREHAGTANP